MKQTRLVDEGRRAPDSPPDAAVRHREREINLECEFRGSNDDRACPGYYLILLRQHHANSRRRWYRRIFVISE